MSHRYPIFQTPVSEKLRLLNVLAAHDIQAYHILQWLLRTWLFSSLLDYAETFPNVGPLEVLGQPLLTQLALKVMANFEGDLSLLLSPPTTLYRHLVDLTCKKGGKHPKDPAAQGGSGHIEGPELRSLLHGTALAITAHGSESIPREELELRIETLELGSGAFELTKDRGIANLMISFYFKGGHELSGCEFLHKSFREYLTAEAIVEILKDFSQRVVGELSEKPGVNFWRDFEASDPRYWLSRKLGEALSPQWLTKEISVHVRHLLSWEVRRASRVGFKGNESSDSSTQAIPAAAWHTIRDVLADLWDWWGEGVHLRIQPVEKQRTWQLDNQPFVVELARLAMRRSNYKRAMAPHPPRTATLDANLGYGLFVLNCASHWSLLVSDGWQDFITRIRPGRRELSVRAARRYQVVVRDFRQAFVCFAPSGGSPFYFRNYVNRINGAGVIAKYYRRPLADDYSADLLFPSFEDLRGLYLAGTELQGMAFIFADLAGCDFNDAGLERALFTEADLRKCNLRAANLFGAHFIDSNLAGADCEKANMFSTDLRIKDLRKVLGLSQNQINETGVAFSNAKLPADLAPPAQWSHRPSHPFNEEVADE